MSKPLAALMTCLVAWPAGAQARKVAYYRLDKVLRGDDLPTGGDIAKGNVVVEELVADGRGGRIVLSVRCWHDNGPHQPRYEFQWRFDRDVSRLSKGDAFLLHYEGRRTDGLGDRCPTGYWRPMAMASVQGGAGGGHLLGQERLPYSGGMLGFPNRDYDFRVHPESNGPGEPLAHDTRVQVGTGDEPWGEFHLVFQARGSMPAAVYLYKAVYEGEENLGACDLSGTWRCDDGGTYVLQESGRQLTWSAQSGDGGQSWSHDFTGTVHACCVVVGQFRDRAPGRARNEGPLVLRIAGPDRLEKVSDESNPVFGGRVWTRERSK